MRSEAGVKPRVLIVDDTPENIRLLMSYLGKTCNVQAATSGAKALEFARASPAPDLILLDVMMPGMSGYDVCEELKRCENTRSIPVIFVTGLNDVEDEKRGLDLGAADYISKPFHADLVRARVGNHLELKRHRDHLADEVRIRTEQLLQAQKSQQRLESELEVASRLQLSMLPPPVLSRAASSGCQLTSYLRPARAVGGDLYDYFFLDRQTLFFVVGDVSDKGVPAALFMVQVRTLLRSLAGKTREPGCLLSQLNEELCRDNQECMFVTLICGCLDIVTGAVILARGGHEHPVLISGQGARFLEFEGGPALGLAEGSEFPQWSGILAAETSIVLYTDGVTEATDGASSCFGEQRLLETLDSAREREVEKIMAGLQENVAAFVADAEPSDDITIMVLQWSPDNERDQSAVISTPVIEIEKQGW